MPDLFDDPAGLPRTRVLAIPYEIESLTVKRSRAPRSGQTTMICRVIGAQANVFEAVMVGRSDANGAILRRTLPERNPQNATQWCTRIEQIDQGGGAGGGGPERNIVSGWPEPLWVRYRCTFEGLPYKVESDVFVDAAAGEKELHRYVIRHRLPQSKEQQFPGGAFKTVNINPFLRFPLGATGFRVVVYADVQYTWVRVPVNGLRTAVYDAALGKFNSVAFDAATDGGYNFAAETLLYIGYDDTDKYFDANSDWVCDVVHTFKFRQFGWNFFLNNVGAAVEVSSDGTAGGTKLYTGNDHHELFRT